MKKFKELLAENKIEIKAYPSRQIHAKVYISRYNSDLLYGSVITGSSNFSESGLNGNYEFNVELKNKTDVDYALEKFDKLWSEAVDISEEYVEAINSKTWLNDEITPYELYLKFLYEYFSEDINAEFSFELDLPEGFMDLKYQTQAVSKIDRIVESYKGVFISDVVGLGKTYIAAMYAQNIKGKKLVIAPPPIIPNWKQAFRDFGVRKYEIESSGMLHKIVDKIDKTNENEYDYNQKFLIGFLNSKLVAFWLKYKGKMQGDNYQVDKEPLVNIPIPKLTKQEEKPFIDMVDKILGLTSQENYLKDEQAQLVVKQYETQIDEMVYKLYELTEEEIVLIEPDRLTGFA